METPIPITVRQDAGRHTIIPHADLGAAHAGALRALLLQLLQQSVGQCCFDLRHMNDLDPLVLAVLISFEQTLHTVAPDAKITIENASPDVRVLLEATHMVERFPLAS
jgi:anti-anti-sigma regulatory factor